MADPNTPRTESNDGIQDEMETRKKLGNKRFHSETSLSHMGENDDVYPEDHTRDPGVQNVSVNGHTEGDDTAKRRAISQPGPVSGVLLTASAARAARKKNVYYANSTEPPKLLIPNGDGSGTATPTGDRGSFPNNPNFLSANFQRNGDLKGLNNNNYRSYASAPTTPRKRSAATMDAQSIRSVETQAPPVTDPVYNKKATRKYLTLITSTMYATLLVTLGLIFHIGDAFTDYPLSSSYSICLAGLGFLYHIFIIIDIGKYKRGALSNQKIKTQYEENIREYFRNQEENFSISSPTPDDFTSNKMAAMPPPNLRPLSHDYCFSQGRHSGSFYLKLGAAGFALGNLVHSVLQITVQLSFLLDEDIDNDDCVEYPQVALDFFYPVYCFTQLYFVFKYSNVIILRAQDLARFAFMHMIGSSLCFWISAIVRETILALSIHAAYEQNKVEEYNTSNDTAVFYGISPEVAEIHDFSNRFFNVSGLYNENCVGPDTITAIVENFSPYLYPFSVEFNILIVAVYYIIWSNIGHCQSEESFGSETNASIEDSYSICKIPTASEENDFTSNIVIHADCHASNRGLFGGLMVMVIIVGMLIIGFVFSNVGGDFLAYGYEITNATKLGLHAVMLFAAILAFVQNTRLDINEHPVSLLDDILLFVCLPPFFMETAFSLLATISILNIVKTVDFIVMVIQVLVQTPLIIDALRRCSNSRKLRRGKPGRELIMFLIITNVGMWLFYTFSYKSPDSLDERYEFYGKVVWTVLGHVSLPLIMFYRFHSSVCFADIWDSAYKPGTEH